MGERVVWRYAEWEIDGAERLWTHQMVSDTCYLMRWQEARDRLWFDVWDTSGTEGWGNPDCIYQPWDPAIYPRLPEPDGERVLAGVACDETDGGYRMFFDASWSLPVYDDDMPAILATLKRIDEVVREWSRGR